MRAVAVCLTASLCTAIASYAYGEWYARITITEQQAVWSAYLNYASERDRADGADAATTPNLLVIEGQTRPVYRDMLVAILWPAVALFDRRMYERLPPLPRSAFARYMLGNLRPHSILDSLTVPVRYKLASAEEIASYGTEDGDWHQRFPHSAGYFTFSAVGFSLDRQRAFLAVDYVCGLCGGGYLVLLRNAGGRWIVEAETMTWIS
jgi:hypothetical protein